MGKELFEKRIGMQRAFEFNLGEHQVKYKGPETIFAKTTSAITGPNFQAKAYVKIDDFILQKDEDQST